MKAEVNHRKRLIAVVAATCLVVACLALAACGGSSSSSAASSSAASSSASASSASASASSAAASASASSAAANSADGFVGTWLVAAAETQGITMGGNFGEMFGASSTISMVINADGTGTMSMGEDASPITWAGEGTDSMYVTVQSDTGATTQEAIPVTYKDGALFMPFEQDGQQATLIFTKDGNYAGAKQITLTGAKPITSEADLLGTWKLVGLNMGGVSMYGDADTMAAAMGGGESFITFKEGGALEMSTGEGSWAVDANGATLTSTDITGTNTVPVVMLDNEIAIDYSSVYGIDLILVFSKA